ncbi:MAG: hydrogenase nickel incorporation protein HypB [Cyanobacteria bacterium HKST-UBA02]|nr:hydrogenase nickel incorporation protein HypB [Cyanobacteria bacterium HKST-UBA02]
MCTECGCGLPQLDHNHEHEHIDEHGNRYTHKHDHGHSHVTGQATDLIAIHKSIMGANDLKAERNRGFFQGIGLLSANVLSSPGSGKTTLLKRLIEELAGKEKCGVIVGDLETDNDARRLRETGAPVVQVSTGTLCHLDAEMVSRALSELPVRNLDILFIENVGNLVCPATFDLGESSRLAILSVTEGEDKPLKYPPLFRFADSIVISKTDLAEACEFDRALAIQNIRAINPEAALFEVSAKTGEGISSLCNHLLSEREKNKEATPA